MEVDDKYPFWERQNPASGRSVQPEGAHTIENIKNIKQIEKFYIFTMFLIWKLLKMREIRY